MKDVPLSKLSRLAQELCPDGAEYRRLGEVCRFNRGTSITKKSIEVGNIPVVAGGRKPAYYCNNSNRNGDTIVISSSGAYAGFVSYWSIPVFVSDAFSVEPCDGLHIRYLFHYLKNQQQNIYSTKKGGGVPHVKGSDISGFQIPLPPLPVQQEIVRILDTFTELETELEEKLDRELELRKKQYEYYRDTLLTFSGNVQNLKLGDICEIVRGNGLKKSDFTTSGVGCIHYGQIYTRYGICTDKTISYVSVILAEKLKKVSKHDLIVTNTSENMEDVCKAVVWLGENDIVTGGHASILKHRENAKYLAYYMQTPMFSAEKKKYAFGTKVIELSSKNLAKIKIPLPPLDEQKRIVEILDRFSTLTSDISVGLPAEIAARRKQYEYYRDKLLTFDEKATNKGAI